MDGRKNNTGKRKGEKVKVPITIYKPADQVKKIGGIDVARTILSASFDKEMSKF